MGQRVALYCLKAHDTREMSAVDGHYCHMILVNIMQEWRRIMTFFSGHLNCKAALLFSFS